MCKITGKYSTIKDYIMITGSLMVINLICSLPFCLVDLISLNWGNLVLFFITSFFSIIYVVMISLLFPVKKENPFSILVGILVSFVAIIVYIPLMIFIKDIYALVISSVLIVIFEVFVSVYSLNKFKIKEVYQ